MTLKRALAIALTAAAALAGLRGAPRPDHRRPRATTTWGRSSSATRRPAAVPDGGDRLRRRHDELHGPAGHVRPARGSGGPPEPLNCGSAYANTIWSVFYADRYGVMKISTAGPFDSVIGFVPFKSPSQDPTPNINAGVCIDRLSGFEEELRAFVKPKQWYAVQVGGTGAPAGGQVQVKFDYQKPPTARRRRRAHLEVESARQGQGVKLVVRRAEGLEGHGQVHQALAARRRARSR